MTMTTIKSAGSVVAPKIFMPTPAQLATVYGSIADKALTDKTAKLLKKAPAGAEKAQGIAVNTKRMGVGETVYNIKGELFLKSQVVAPGAKAKWFDIGKAPLF
jgi:hypothetical protein